MILITQYRIEYNQLSLKNTVTINPGIKKIDAR
jgi:hypothetical protein